MVNPWKTRTDFELPGIVDQLPKSRLLKLDYMSRFYLNARYKEDIQELTRGVTEEICREFVKLSEGIIKWLCQTPMSFITTRAGRKI